MAASRSTMTRRTAALMDMVTSLPWWSREHSTSRAWRPVACWHTMRKFSRQCCTCLVRELGVP